MLIQGVEPVRPDAALVVDPATEKRQLIGAQAAAATGAIALLLDQAGPPQDTDMVGDRLRSQVERFSELAHRGVPLREATDQGATDGVAESGKGGVEV